MRKSASASRGNKRKSTVRRKSTALKNFNVEFRGKSFMRGVITVSAVDDQAARTLAFARYMNEGIVWNYIEEDEDYATRIVEVDPL